MSRARAISTFSGRPRTSKDWQIVDPVSGGGRMALGCGPGSLRICRRTPGRAISRPYDPVRCTGFVAVIGAPCAER